MATLSLDSARALLAGDDIDRRRLNEAVARAMDPPWERVEGDCPGWERVETRKYVGRISYQERVRVNRECPPAHLSDDPRLNREMREALRLACVGTIRMVFTDHQVSVSIPADLDDPNPLLWAVHTGSTEAEALVLALAAAGMLKEEDDGTA